LHYKNFGNDTPSDTASRSQKKWIRKCSRASASGGIWLC